MDLPSLTPFLKGLILGFSIAAPVGPIGVLCIRRTLADGRLHGFFSGLGAASADMLYGSVAAFGLTAVSGMLVSQQTALRLAGGIFLLYLGVRTIFSPAAKHAANTRASHGLAGAYGSTFLLTLTNPMTILSFAAVFAGLGLAAGSADPQRAAWLVAGVFCGSGLWWFTLSGVVGLARAKVTPAALGWVNRMSGLVIGGFGVAALVSLLG
jgi:threonine/homoserine/homoserine lactone efflux protein